jgi:prepilin-type N-terminal cleavage/methylation domain-containing protein
MNVSLLKRRSAAFTLVELLVVISIIALLAGLGLSAINKANDKAKMIVSVNNLKQIGLSMKLYSSDYDGQFPLGWVSGSNMTDTAGAAGIADANTSFRALFGGGYISDERVFFYPGPTYFKRPDNNFKDNQYEKALEAGENSYSYFIGLAESDDGQQPLACDTPQGSVAVVGSGSSGSTANSGWTFSSLSTRINSGSGLHMLYVDGSVGFVKKTGEDGANAKVTVKVSNPNGRFVPPLVK